MRVVIVTEDADGRGGSLVGELASECRQVLNVDHANVEAELRRELPQVLIVVCPSTGGADLLRSLCALDRTSAMYVVTVIGADLPRRAIASAVAAGSHDVLCEPYAREELHARIDVQRRLRRWTRKCSIATPDSPPSKLTGLRAWEYLGDVVVDDFVSLFGKPLALEERWLKSAASLHVATISMSLPREQLELCISIGADPSTRCVLGQHLLGDADASEDALDDVMRELANVAGGALKRAAIPEGSVLATGIPVEGRSLPARENGTRMWAIPLGGDAEVIVVGEVRRRVNRQIPARRLAEGMVVAGDVLNSAGVLLLASGTRLTATTAERLSRLLDTALVDVSG
jgi:DNA-binding response OmpR family regulator